MSRGTRADSRQFNDVYAWMYGHMPKVVTFIVTHQCNLRCTYCYEHNKSDARMSIDTAKACVDLLFTEDAKNSRLINYEDAHGLILDFIGGEPLLEIDLIDQVLDYFLSKAIELDHRWQTQYMITMSTNGTLGNTKRVEDFMKKWEGRLSISVTIDGSKEAHDACRVDTDGNGSYDRAIQMFRRVSGPSGAKTTKYTIAPGNIDKLYDATRHLIADEHIDYLHCNCVYETGWTQEDATSMYHQLKSVSDYVRSLERYVYVSILDWEAGKPQSPRDTQNWCGGDGRMLAFDVDGTIIPCVRWSSIAIDQSKRPLYRIGDVECGIGTRSDDCERLDNLMSITRQSQSTDTCINCPIGTGCGWCTAYNYEVTGTPNKRVTYICCMHKARVLAQCYHHNMLHLKDPSHEPKKMYIPKEWALEIISEEEYQMLKDLELQAFNGNIPEDE